jgi:UrcA family protein
MGRSLAQFTPFCGWERPVRDESVCRRDDLDGGPLTADPAAASHTPVVNHTRRLEMNTLNTNNAGVSRPKITLMMLLCGLVSAASVGAASAAAGDGDVPSIAVRFSQESLATDAGARQLYRRLIAAAEEVCPNNSVGNRWVTGEVAQCRKQAVARAVSQINSPRLAALYASSSKSG